MSGVLMTVPNRPIVSTVPITPPALIDVADLERTEEDEEHAGREVRQQAAPCHADRDTAGGEQRGERGGFDAEEAEDRDDQRDVQDDLERRLDVARQRTSTFCLVNAAAVRRSANEINQRPTRKRTAAPATFQATATIVTLAFSISAFMSIGRPPLKISKAPVVQWTRHYGVVGGLPVVYRGWHRVWTSA